MHFKPAKVAVLLAAALATSGCSFFKKPRPTTPVLGERVAVLAAEVDVQVDPATAALPMVLPAPVANSEWTQSGGNPSKSMGHVQLGSTLAQAWTVQAGSGTTVTARLASSPVVAGGRVYTIDTNAIVRAFDAQTGAAVWRTQFGTEAGNNAARHFSLALAQEISGTGH